MPTPLRLRKLCVSTCVTSPVDASDVALMLVLSIYVLFYVLLGLWKVRYIAKHTFVAVAGMTEQTPTGELEKTLASHPSRYQVAEEAIVGKNAEELKAKMPELAQEDFTDPHHPLYGTVDEFGRPLPGWLEQITVRWELSSMSCDRIVIACVNTWMEDLCWGGLHLFGGVLHFKSTMILLLSQSWSTCSNLLGAIDGRSLSWSWYSQEHHKSELKCLKFHAALAFVNSVACQRTAPTSLPLHSL